MTLADLKNMSNTELIRIANAIDKQTASFKQITNAEFSYTAFSNELKKRNIRRIYVDTDSTDKITVDASNKTCDTVRQQYTVSKDVAEMWKSFIQEVDVKYPSVLLDAALLEFMNTYYNDHLEIKK